MSKPHRSPSHRKATGRQEPTPKSDTPPSSLLRRLWKWLVAAVATPLAAFLGLYLTGLLNEVFPAVPDLMCQARELTRSPEPGATFRILLATLEHDTDGRQTRHVQYALRGQTAFKVVPACRILKIDYGITQSEIEGEKRGRAWLEANQADVLIWGDVAKSDETLRLWFLSREGSTLKPEARSSYTLEKTTLPKDFDKDFAIQLMALVLSSIQPVTEQAGTYLAAAMRPVAARLNALRAHPPAVFTPLQKATLHHSFALAAQTIGEQAGETRWLMEAVQAFRAALEERTRERVPLDWAMTQDNLGKALAILGERESGTARLEEAVVAYRAALEEYTRERVPLQWAITQTYLGTALRILGERESGTARLEEAVQAFRAALEKGTRERVPLNWAATQNNLGNALVALGERESGTARLEEAVQAFRTALEEFTRERVPLDWAMTQNNLGGALVRLGGRESGTARLEEAMQAFRAALEEFTRERMPLRWAATQNNLGSALVVLGGRESGTARLEEAVQAFRAALEERTRERVPLDWAWTQNNLGIALVRLGERESGTARLEEAVQAFRAALNIFDAAHAEYYRARVQRTLDTVSSILETRNSGK